MHEGSFFTKEIPNIFVSVTREVRNNGVTVWCAFLCLSIVSNTEHLFRFKSQSYHFLWIVSYVFCPFLPGRAFLIYASSWNVEGSHPLWCCYSFSQTDVNLLSSVLILSDSGTFLFSWMYQHFLLWPLDFDISKKYLSPLVYYKIYFSKLSSSTVFFNIKKM